MLNAAQLVKHVNDQENEVRVSLLLLVCLCEGTAS